MGMNEHDDDDDDDVDGVEVMLVEDVELFLFSLRERVSVTIAANAIEPRNLDEYMTMTQMKSTLGDYVDGVDEETGCPFLLVESYEELVDDLSRSFLGACLAKLAAADLVETAWDDERGQQIFWTKKGGGEDD